MMNSLRIPKKLNVGCGNIIKIEEVSSHTIQSAIGRNTEGAWSVDVPDTSPYVGVIFLDKTLPKHRKREILYHELVHALNDIYLWSRDSYDG